MNIKNHMLIGVTQQILPGGDPMFNRRALVIHFTAGASGQSSIDFWKTKEARGASAHIVIERNGGIIQVRPFNRTCGHAGVSRWRDPKTGQLHIGANGFSIGIELANAGNSKKAMPWARTQPGFKTIFASHRNGGTKEEWEVFPKAQFDACVTVAKAVVKEYNLDDITGHENIAPERKNDPGPAFPMGELRHLCGFSGLPSTFYRK